MEVLLTEFIDFSRSEGTIFWEVIMNGRGAGDAF